MSVVSAIAINVLSGILGLLLGRFWRQALARMRQNSLREFWSFTNPRAAIVFPMYGDPRNGPEAPRIMAHVEDILGIAKITRLLDEFHRDYRLVDDHRELKDDEDLVLVCSPLGNRQSKEFLNRQVLPFLYVGKGPSGPAHFRDTETDTLFTAPMDTGGGHADVALVAKLKQTNPKRTVFVFWGLHGPGTLGAIDFAVDRKQMDKIESDVRRGGGAFLLSVAFYRTGGDEGSGPRETGPVKLISRTWRHDTEADKWEMN